MNKWLGFWALSIIWGSSFLLIRVSIQEMSELQVVFIRTLIAAVGLNLVLLLRRTRIPTDWRSLRTLVVIGIANPVFPFILITWGEKSVESGLASVLQSTTALFGLVLAHFAFTDERMNAQKVVGVLLSFVGVWVLTSRSWAGGEVVTSDLLGQLAIVVASLFYAVSTTYSKRYAFNLDPVVISAGAMTTGAIVTGALLLVTPVLGAAPPTPLAEISANVLLSVLVLGLFNTFLAYFIYYGLVRSLGSARTQMVTYVIPVVGLALGALFLNEVVDASLLAGAALILLGIGVVNMRAGRLWQLRRVQPAP